MPRVKEDLRYRLHEQLAELGFIIDMDGPELISPKGKFRPKAYWRAVCVERDREVLLIGLSKIRDIRPSPVGIQVRKVKSVIYYVGLPDDLREKLNEAKELLPIQGPTTQCSTL